MGSSAGVGGIGGVGGVSGIASMMGSPGFSLTNPNNLNLINPSPTQTSTPLQGAATQIQSPQLTYQSNSPSQQIQTPQTQNNIPSLLQTGNIQGILSQLGGSSGQLK